MRTQKQGQRRRNFSLTLKMFHPKSRINPEVPFTDSIEEPELRTKFPKTMPTALTYNMGKEIAMSDSQNTNEGHKRLDFITVDKEYSTDELLLNIKTTPTEEKETLVRSWHPRGDRVILLVLCLMCTAALGLSLLMLFGVLRPHCPPDTKIGKNESTRCLCDSFPLYSLKPQIFES